MTATIEKDSVWYPRHKSRGVHLVVQEVDESSVKVMRHDPQEKEPHEQKIRVTTLLDRYEREP